MADISSSGGASENRFLPMHGSSKELGTGLVSRIKKDLGLR
jgi:hypothetical protein